MTRVPGLRLLAPAFIALLTIAGLGAVPSAGAAEQAEPAQRADAIMTGAPRVGQCFDASKKEAWGQSLTSTPVACSQDHTLRVTAVERVPASVDLTDLEGAGMSAVNSACVGSVAKVVGRNPLHRARSLYASFWFIPTAAQREAGAHWASCLVGVRDTKGVNDLPSGRLPKASRKPADAVAYCVTARFATVTCAEKHAYRATHSAFVKTPRSAKAADAALKRAGAKTCSRKTGRTSRFDMWRHTPKKGIVVCLRKTRK